MVTCTMHGRMMILLQKQQQMHKGRSRDQIMAAVPDNVLERGDRHDAASGTVYEHYAL